MGYPETIAPRAWTGYLLCLLVSAFHDADKVTTRLAARRRAAIRGDGNAAMALAMQTGDIVARERYLAMAARAEHPKAGLHLLNLYAQHGTPQVPDGEAISISMAIIRTEDPNRLIGESILMLQDAANQGNQSAQLALAEAFCFGQLKLVRFTEAYLWASIATGGPNEWLVKASKAVLRKSAKTLSKEEVCELDTLVGYWEVGMKSNYP